MITILLVEDQPQKAAKIKDVILGVPDIKNDDLMVVSDIMTAKRILLEKQFDLLILDVQLPIRFGDEPLKTAGIDFLREITSDPEYTPPFHIIGLTQHEDLKQSLSDQFSKLMWQLIYYAEQENSWSNQIISFIGYLIRSKIELQSPSNAQYNYDVGIVTALHQIELENILKLDANWTEFKFQNDHTRFYKGIFSSPSKKLNVVAGCASQMGMTAMGLITQKLIFNFRPKLVIICGIAAGIKDKGNLGDILVADLSWDYGSGKIAQHKDGSYRFLQDPRPIPLDPELKEIVQHVQANENYSHLIEQKWKSTNGMRIDHKLKMLYGPFASGSYVIENLKKVQEVVDQQRKLIGIDMEAYAVFYSAANCSSPRPKAMAIKSLCDYGDDDKNDKYQNYAGFTSANFMYHFCLENL